MSGRLAVAVAVVTLIASPLAPADAQSGALPSAGPMPRRSACELLSESEVAQAIGSSIDEGLEWAGEADESGWLSQCLYRRNFEQAPLDLTLASGPSYVATFDDILLDPAATPLDGVGDEAVIRLSTVWGLDQPVGALFARAGGVVVGLTLGIVDVTEDGTLVQVGDAARQQQVLMALATIAIGRLDEPLVESAKLCDLLSAADASSLAGESLASSEEIDQGADPGPGCLYRSGDNSFQLFIGVDRRPEATSRYESCQTTGAPVPGTGVDAFVGQGDCGLIQLGFYVFQGPLFSRSGDAIVTVGLFSERGSRSLDSLIGIARSVYERLGLDAGPPPPPPVAEQALAHPCDLISLDEVSAIVGEPITSTLEQPASSGYPLAECDYLAGDGRFVPLVLWLSAGEYALQAWSTYRSDGSGKVPVEGIGDDALSQDLGYADLPLVRLWVLSGDAVLQLDMGTVGVSADGSTDIVLGGTADEQLAMLRQLAQIILPRLRQ